MADKIDQGLTERIDTDDIGEIISTLKSTVHAKRFSFERRWYDNNFFDDGFHFRFLLRQQNKIMDLGQNRSMYAPLRALPKASKQIRGITNLLVSQDYTPVVYPEKIGKDQYPDQQGPDGQPIPNPEYKAAMDEAKKQARMQGRWLTKEFMESDIKEKLAAMCLLTMKHGISYLKIWPDAIKETIKTSVRDAFDIYLLGENNDLQDCPFIIESTPVYIAEVKANEWFDAEQVKKINPDNRYASSDIKQAYMNVRYSMNTKTEYAASVMLNETYMKEYLSKENTERIKKQKNGADILSKKKEGDVVIRQVFSVGNIWLRDQYIEMDEYPYAEFRMEPGPLYQVPQIERFMPANKSLDLVSSRVERYTHSMVAGIWIQPASEGNLDISNKAGGQIIKYKAVPPQQAQIAPLPAFIFNFMQFLNGVIEEQGVTTSVLGQIPNGVKANSAIENLKESEYAGLIMAQSRLKKTVKDIAKKHLYLADNYFITPKTVYYLEKGEPQYFDIIGQYAYDKREELKIGNPDGVIPISKGCYVDIEIEQGMGYTQAGKKEAMEGLMANMVQLAAAGYIPPDAMKIAVEQYLDAYKFGRTQDFMEAIDNAQMSGNLSEQQIQAVKVAVLETMKDLMGSDMFPDQKTRIDETKVGMAEFAKDSGLLNNKMGDPKTEVEVAAKKQEMIQSFQKHQADMEKSDQEMKIQQEKADVDIQTKEQMAQQSMQLKAKQAQQKGADKK